IPRVRRQLLHEPRLVLRVARDTIDQLGIARDEREVEELGFRLLLVVDPLLLVALERRSLLHGVERLAGKEGLVEDVVDVDVEVAIQSRGALRRRHHLDLRRLDLACAHTSSIAGLRRDPGARSAAGTPFSRSTIPTSSNTSLISKSAPESCVSK